jgi:hypothetical protein
MIMEILALTGITDQLFQITEKVLQTGIPLAVEYQGRVAQIVAVQPSSQSVTERLTAHPWFTQPRDFDMPTEWIWNDMKNLNTPALNSTQTPLFGIWRD